MSQRVVSAAEKRRAATMRAKNATIRDKNARIAYLEVALRDYGWHKRRCWYLYLISVENPSTVDPATCNCNWFAWQKYLGAVADES